MSAGALARLFTPKSIAVVGASASPGKAGYEALKVLESFTGEVYPINPKAEGDILGHKAFPALSAIGKPVDLAVMALPAPACVAAVADGAKAGLGAALIISGGFREAGDEGAALQDELMRVAHEGGIRVLGPNTSGFVNPVDAVTASFVPGVDTVRPGPLGIIAQSGGVNLTLAFLAQALGVGTRLAVGLGNAPDVDAAACLDFLADDPETRAIALHLEGVADGVALTQAVRRASARKPVIALLAGKTDIGTFAQSHTGNLLGNHALKKAALEAAGAVVVDTTEQLIDAASTLACRRLPPKKNPGVAIVTGQAGPGLLILDRLQEQGAEVPDLQEATKARIAEKLPPLTFIGNPVDTGRPGPSFADILADTAEDPGIDAVLVYAIHEPAAIEPEKVIGGYRGSAPIVFGTMGPDAFVRDTVAGMWASAIPALPSPERAADALITLIRDAQAQARRTEPPAVSLSVEPGRLAAATDELGGKELMEALGLTAPKRVVATDRDQAGGALATLTAPLAVKVLDPAILHKTEAGGVHLFVRDQAGLDAALDAIDAIPNGGPHRRYLIEEMAPKGVDLILGATRDPAFGPTVLVGIGGTEAELLRDTAAALAPVSVDTARAMIESLKMAPLLQGWRGAARADIDAAAHALAVISQLIAAAPEIAEIDINPLRVLDKGALVLDALIVRNAS